MTDRAPLRMVPLAELDSGLQSLFGGKACGLAKLIEAGAKVPEGFAVETTSIGPEAWLEAERAELQRRAAELRGLVAVRSSAVGEDSAEKSFAGMFETVLGVGTPHGVVEAAARCIAAGASPRVLAYAGSVAPVPVGLVIQELVDARCAGVCFTQDPSGRDAAIVVEAVAGPGAQLVSGSIEPERWRVYRTGLGAWESRVAASRSVLSSTEVERIAAQARDPAARFGCPLDLEWAIDRAGTLWWLQARPITGLRQSPSFVIQRSVDPADDGPVTVWSNWNVRETMPDPLLPLTWSVWRELIIPRVMEQLLGIRSDTRLNREMAGLDLIHGHVYFNMNCVLAFPLYSSLITWLLDTIDARAGSAVRELRAKGILRPRRLPGSRPLLMLRIAASTVRAIGRMSAALRPRAALRALEEDGTAVSRRRSVRTLRDDELLDEMRLLLQPECRRLMYGLQMESVAVMVYSAAVHVFRSHLQARNLLATGIPANPTTQISVAIDELVEAARPIAHEFCAQAGDLLGRLQAEPAARPWLTQFRFFLDRFGHRGPMEFDLGATRWSEDPAMVLELVRAGLRSTGREPVAKRMARLSEERDRAIATAVAASPWWKRPVMRWLARLVELYMPLREAPKHHGVFVFRRMRDAARELGRRFADRGAISSVDDVFYLEWPELVRLVQGGPLGTDPIVLVEERKKQFVRFRTEHAPDFLRSDGVPVEEDAATDRGQGGQLRGTPVSAGSVSGPVRILREPDPRAMEDGDVIVVEFADPGWTPLFPRAAAVVMEVGGTLCHAAVVAREMGIPAVFGVRDATHLLRDGQRVRVDGGAGTVDRE
ncbi:MAG: PEP/pyruvate-binding domain-containing protein [Acidobacteriota bacterium]